MAAEAPKPMTILIVDDDAPTRKVLVRMLRELGYDTLEAENGTDAVREYGANHERIVAATLDLEMPETDGRATLAILSDIAPFLPMVIVSGTDLHSAALQGRVPGTPGVAYLKKPFRKEQLHAALNKVLGESGRR